MKDSEDNLKRVAPFYEEFKPSDKAGFFSGLGNWILQGLYSIGYGLNSILDYLAITIGNWIEDEDACMDRLVDERMAELSSGTKRYPDDSSLQEVYAQELKELFICRKMHDAFTGALSWYEVYDKAGLEKAAVKQSRARIFSPHQNTGDGKKQSLLLQLDNSTDSSPFLAMHQLHDAMMMLKQTCSGKSPNAITFSQLESEFKKIKFGKDGDVTITKVEDQNRAIFVKIRKLITDEPFKSSLTEVIDNLATAKHHPYNGTAFYNEANEYEQEHCDLHARELRFPEVLEAFHSKQGKFNPLGK